MSVLEKKRLWAKEEWLKSQSCIFFSLLSPKTVIGLTISCVRKEEDSQSNENDDQSNRNFPTVDIATLTKRVTHFVLYIYLCDFAKRCPLSFCSNTGIACVQASVAGKKLGDLPSC